MDRLAVELASSLSTGPSISLRREIREALPGVTNLKLRLDLSYSETLAETPDILAIPGEPWQLRLGQRNEDAREPPVLSPGPQSGPLGTLSMLEEQNGALEDGDENIICPIYELTWSRDYDPYDNPYDSAPSSSTTAANTPQPIGHLVATSNVSRNTPVIQLAAALSRNGSFLRSFTTSVESALFAPHYTPSEGSIDLDNVLASEGDTSTRETPSEQRVFRPDILANASQGNRRFRQARTPFRQPLSVSLRFAGAQEVSFSRWYARHMWRYDTVAMLMCVVFQTVLVFVPGTAFGLFFRLPIARWALGYCHMLPLAMMTTSRGRSWYRSHRDAILLCLLLMMLVYHHKILENYRHIGPPTVMRCGNVAYSFLWIPFVALLFQMRFRILAPTIAVCTAVNLTLLGDLCEGCPSATPTRRCIGRGASKVGTIVVAALCVVYCVEWRARRLWVALTETSSRF